MALLVAGGVAERELSKYRWQTSDKAGLWSALRGDDTVSGYGFRAWNTAGADAATLTLDVRLAAGQPAWDWFRSDARFVLEPQRAPDYPHTRVWVPEAVPGAGPPYLMRTFDLGEPIGGRIFRVLLDLRRAPQGQLPAVSTAGEPPLETTLDAPTGASGIDPGRPIGGRDCQGISLQAWAPRGGGRCLPVTPGERWQRYSLSWRVPAEVEASVVRVVLNGFADETLDVRRVRLFTVNGELGPLQPQGGALQLAWGRRPEAHAGRSFIPTAEWQTLSVRETRAAGDTLTATLTTAAGLTLQTRNLRVTAPDGTSLPNAVSSARQTIIFGDPNLAGHTLGALGLAAVALSGPWLGALGGALTLAGAALTGSRAALIGTLAGLLGLFWLALPRGARRLGFGALAALLLALAGGAWPQLSALRLFSLGEVTARRDIWAAAWDAFSSHPGRGLGAGGFPAYWADLHGGEAVQHAHNLWLEFAAGYGVLGLASVLALTLGLGVLAWRWGGARALVLVAGTLLMNVFDTTLFYTGVLFSLTLALGAFRGRLRSRAAPLHAALGSASHNAEVAAPPPSQVPPQ